jgi:hypothetical protein
MIAPLRILQARAEARAYLWAAGEFTLDEALEPLYAYAIESGIASEYGTDQVAIMIDTAFELESGS